MWQLGPSSASRRGVRTYFPSMPPAGGRRGFILERRRTDRRIVSFHRESRGLAEPAEFPLLRKFPRS